MALIRNKMLTKIGTCHDPDSNRHGDSRMQTLIAVIILIGNDEYLVNLPCRLYLIQFVRQQIPLQACVAKTFSGFMVSLQRSTTPYFGFEILSQVFQVVHIIRFRQAPTWLLAFEVLMGKKLLETFRRNKSKNF